MASGTEGEVPNLNTSASSNVLKVIVGKLKDWAALTVVALFISTAPVCYWIGNVYAGCILSFALSLAVLGTRICQMRIESVERITKIDADRELKLQALKQNHQIKLRKISKQATSGDTALKKIKTKGALSAELPPTAEK